MFIFGGVGTVEDMGTGSGGVGTVVVFLCGGVGMVAEIWNGTLCSGCDTSSGDLLVAGRWVT